MPKILHTADLHLGSPLGGLPEPVAKTLRDEGFDVLKQLCELARNTDALIISGDLFDNPSPPKSIAERAAALLETAGVPVFISPGNHDYLHRRSPYKLVDFPQNVHIFDANSVQCVSLDDFDVYGAGFDSDKSGPLLSGFHAAQGRPSVMALHCELSPSVPKYNPVTPSEIEASGLSYLALGHIHKRSLPSRSGDTVYAFCGCPYGRGFDETGERGAYLVELSDTVDVQFVPLEARRFHDIEARLTPNCDPFETTREALPSNCKRDLVHIRLSGEFPPDLLRVSDISHKLADTCFYLKVSDKTRLPKRVWERSRDDTLAGIVVTLAHEQLGLNNDSELELAVRYALAALDGEEAPL